MKIFKGFTLTELMVAITVLGLLCAAVLPGLLRNRPNQNKIMMKKAFYTTTEIINEMINDTEHYPDIDGICPYNDEYGYVGFDCIGNGTSQFPFLFSKYINLKDGEITQQSSFASSTGKNTDAECNGVDTPCYYLVSSNGIIWTVPKNYTLDKGNKNHYITLGFDVNGAKKPNCYQGSSNANCKGRTSDFDQAIIYVYADGKIAIPSTQSWAKDTIQIDTALTGD